MKNKLILRIWKIIFSILILIFIIFMILFIKQNIINKKINDDISGIYANAKYETAVKIEGINPIKQEVSCGYAVIEILSNWLNKDITEQSLLEENEGKISTAMGNGFFNEMSKQFPEYSWTTRFTNLTNTQLIDKIYDSIKSGMPVPIEFAAIYKENESEVWTLHFAIVTGIDIKNDAITVCNPYGYTENYTVQDFLNATRYDSFENMPFYFKLGFTINLFTKNTIYIIG